ncbi:MAG: YihY/virulence factor BrkB family protein [Candidatus Pacebacteria bacterium]|nr:YihY/virulence factor BrkB family protein [Candidatus Paceibacterota bacterium]
MKIFDLIFRSAKLWYLADMKSYAAAFSYYAPLAILPLLLFSISVVGIIYGEAFTKQIITNWGLVLGQDLIEIIRSAIDNLKTEANTFTIPMVGVIFFAGASILTLNVLSNGFYKLWKVERFGFINWLKKSARSILFVLIFQLYLIIIIAFEIFLNFANLRGDTILSLIFLFVSTGTFFAILFRFLASNAPSTSGCIVGATLASVLFVISKSTISIYIINLSGLNLYGAAGLILILLIWIYVLAAIIYFGAAVAHEYDKMNDRR